MLLNNCPFITGTAITVGGWLSSKVMLAEMNIVDAQTLVPLGVVIGAALILGKMIWKAATEFQSMTHKFEELNSRLEAIEKELGK